MFYGSQYESVFFLLKEVFMHQINLILFLSQQVIQYLSAIGGEISIPRIVLSSIGCYRVWYHQIYENLPNDYSPPRSQDYYRPNVGFGDIQNLHKQVKRNLLHLNRLTRAFNRNWGKDIRLAYGTLDGSMAKIGHDLGYFDPNALQVNVQLPLPIHIRINNGPRNHLDTVTHSIMDAFPAIGGILFRLM